MNCYVLVPTNETSTVIVRARPAARKVRSWRSAAF